MSQVFLVTVGLSAIRKFRISLIAGPSRTGLRFQAGGEHAFGMEDVKKSRAGDRPPADFRRINPIGDHRRISTPHLQCNSPFWCTIELSGSKAPENSDPNQKKQPLFRFSSHRIENKHVTSKILILSFENKGLTYFWFSALSKNKGVTSPNSRQPPGYAWGSPEPPLQKNATCFRFTTPVPPPVDRSQLQPDLNLLRVQS